MAYSKAHMRRTTHSKGVVNDKRDAVVMRDLGECRDVVDNILGVCNTFNIDRFGLVVDSGGESFRRRFCDPFDTNAIVLECHLKLIVCLEGARSVSPIPLDIRELGLTPP